METFTIRPMTWPVLRLLSRNPLIRTSDRIETAAATAAVALMIIAAACAGIVGMSIHDTETQKFLAQAQTRHALAATAIHDSEPDASSGTKASMVDVSWQANGINHIDVVGWGSVVKAGDALPIWVDTDGNRVAPPTPVKRAAADALTAAVVGWLIVVFAAVNVILAVRAHASRMRDAQWEEDIRCLVDGDGGRANHQQ